MLEYSTLTQISGDIESKLDRDWIFLRDDDEIYFQHDGAPPHYVLSVVEWAMNLQIDGYGIEHLWSDQLDCLIWEASASSLNKNSFFLHIRGKILDIH